PGPRGGPPAELSFRRRRNRSTAQIPPPATAAPINAQAHPGRPFDSSDGLLAAAAPAAAAAGAWLVDVVLVAAGVVTVCVWMTVFVCVGPVTVVVFGGAVTVLVSVTVFAGGGAVAAVVVVVGEVAAVAVFVVEVVAWCWEDCVSPLVGVVAAPVPAVLPLVGPVAF